MKEVVNRHLMVSVEKHKSNRTGLHDFRFWVKCQISLEALKIQIGVTLNWCCGLIVFN